MPSDSVRRGGVVDQVTMTDATGSTTFLVGWVADDPTSADIRPVVWRVTATQIELVTDKAFGTDSPWLNAVTLQGNQLIAVGRTEREGRSVATVWEAALGDPSEWDKVFEATEESSFIDVTASDGQVVALSSIAIDGTRRAASASRGAEGWSGMVPITSPEGDVDMAGLAADNGGQFRAAGVVQRGDDYSVLSWQSTDGGVTWSQVELPTTDRSNSVDFIGYARGGFFVTGTDFNNRPLLWTSTNETLWQVKPLGSREVFASATVNSAIIDGDDVLLGAYLTDPRGGRGAGVVVWAADGLFKPYIVPVEQVTATNTLLFPDPTGMGRAWAAMTVPGTFAVRSFPPSTNGFEPGGAIPEGGTSTTLFSATTNGEGLLTLSVTRPVRYQRSGFLGPRSELRQLEADTWGDVNVIDDQDVAGVLALVTTKMGIFAPAVAIAPGSDAQNVNDLAVLRFDETGKPTGVITIEAVDDQSPTGFAYDGQRLWISASSTQRYGEFLTQPQIWTSDNGVDWERSMGSFDQPRVVLNDICSTNQGVMAVGAVTTSEGGRQAAAWILSDNSQWRELEVAGGGRVAEATTCAEGGDPIVGGRIDDRAALWSFKSTDDTSQMVAMEPPPGLQSITALATVDGSVIVAGRTSHPLTSRAEILRSDDLVNWTSIDFPQARGSINQVIVTILINDGVLQVTGQLGSAGVLWSLPLRG